MIVTETNLAGVKLIQPVVHRDDRGFFVETYHQRRYVEAGMPSIFVQDNHSRSVKGTVRGLHMQRTSLQAKLVRVILGEIFDVAVDVRVGSPTFGRWTGARLSDANGHQFYVPEGFAHGFAVVSDVAEVEYKCSAFYDVADEIAIRFDDPAIGVAWPVTSPILSRRDAGALPLAEHLPQLPPFAAP
ncbi:MAG: dTDP-4-dehydrorhamnose 3,5-epimerase [Acidobacteria bacterium]|nr:dTDP-4-dehydrorhamnose 3,5-epimerase [Acidobacteriota bacterium]